jgi:hypothetical protein
MSVPVPTSPSERGDGRRGNKRNSRRNNRREVLPNEDGN